MKDGIKKMRSQAQTERKHLQDTSDKGLLSKIYKDLLKLNYKKTAWFKKRVRDLNRHLTKKDTDDKHVKRCSTAYVKLKWQPDTATHMLEKTKPETGHQMLMRMGWNNKDSLSFAKWDSHFGRQIGSNYTYSYHTFQQLHSLTFTPKNWKCTSTQPAYECLQQLYSCCQLLEAIKVSFIRRRHK